MKRNFVRSLMGISALLLGGWRGGCGAPLNQDPSFDLWCQEQLCAWAVEKGEIKKAATWHRSDYGVELVGDPVVISQLLTLNSAGTSCLSFEFLTDKDEGVNLLIELDFQDDGSLEYSHPIPDTDWVPTTYLITPPTWFDSLRVRIRKEGSGRAELAQIVLLQGQDCTEEPLPLNNRPLGANCEDASQCQSGLCAETIQMVFGVAIEHKKVCNECASGADCAGQEVCGIEPSATSTNYRGCGEKKVNGSLCDAQDQCRSARCVSVPQGYRYFEVELELCSGCAQSQDCLSGEACGRAWVPELPWWSYLDCGPRGRHVLGERCVTDEECSTGLCVDRVCSECNSNSRLCPGGAACERRTFVDMGWEADLLLMPWQCSPGKGGGESGAFCLHASDCRSNACEGEQSLRLCDEFGNRCERSEDCVSVLEQQKETCLTLGVDGGKCR